MVAADHFFLGHAKLIYGYPRRRNVDTKFTGEFLKLMHYNRIMDFRKRQSLAPKASTPRL